jgi:hypothetical protein
MIIYKTRMRLAEYNDLFWLRSILLLTDNDTGHTHTGAVVQSNVSGSISRTFDQ